MPEQRWSAGLVKVESGWKWPGVTRAVKLAWRRHEGCSDECKAAIHKCLCLKKWIVLIDRTRPRGISVNDGDLLDRDLKIAREGCSFCFRCSAAARRERKSLSGHDCSNETE